MKDTSPPSLLLAISLATSRLINRDQGRVGTGLQATIVNLASTPGTLRRKVINPADAGDDETIAQAVIQENAWIAVVGACLFPFGVA